MGIGMEVFLFPSAQLVAAAAENGGECRGGGKGEK